jgi:hypothetical protein
LGAKRICAFFGSEPSGSFSWKMVPMSVLASSFGR